MYCYTVPGTCNNRPVNMEYKPPEPYNVPSNRTRTHTCSPEVQGTITVKEEVASMESGFFILILPIFDKNCSMVAQLNSTCRSAWFHLSRIGKIRSYLNKPAAEKVIHAFVTSKIDNLNCLLYGLPKVQLDKLKRIQYAAARIITRVKKVVHMKPIICSLH